MSTLVNIQNGLLTASYRVCSLYQPKKPTFYPLNFCRDAGVRVNEHDDALAGEA